MKIVASHKYRTGKELRVTFLNRTDQRKMGVPECDVFALSRIDDGVERTTYYNPTELIILIQLFGEALYKGIKGYSIGLKRERKP